MKVIKGFENYQITTDGRIFSIKTKKWLNPTFDKYGYLQVCIMNNKPKSCRVHRLVALTYLNAVDGKNIINHKNGIKTDNRVENLEWVTVSENINHSWKSGLSENIRIKNSKVVLDTQIGIFYESAKEASKSYKFAYSTLRAMLNGGLKNNTSLVYV